MTRQTDIRRISIFLPIVCIVFAGALAYSQFRRLGGLEEQEQVLQGKIDRLNASLKAHSGSTAFEKIATFPRTVDEEPNFLTRLKQLAGESGVQILRWTSTAKPAGAAPGGDGKQPSSLKDVTEIASKLDIAGPYDKVRAFTVRVLDSPRLLTISDVIWAREPKLGTKISMTLSRYVSPPEAGAPTGASAAPKTPPAGESK